ncbi:MAG: hypothetical protein Q7R56_02775 [Nanoarchaeota archaeon]|nr:hypothetical protein [Nanoarchaeota archaeon]
MLLPSKHVNGITTWKHQEIYLQAAIGITPKTIEELELLVQQQFTEVGTKTYEHKGTTIAAFNHRPFIDFTVKTDQALEPSVVALTFEETTAYETITTFTTKAGITYYPHDKEFINDLQSMLLFSINNLETLRKARRYQQKSLKTLFASVYYRNFLDRYTSFTEEQKKKKFQEHYPGLAYL